MGSQAQAVLDCIEDEEESDRGKPIDVEYILSNVLPSVLSLTRTSQLQSRSSAMPAQL